MLIVSRRVGESIWLADDNIQIQVVRISRSTVKIGINAPAWLGITYKEKPEAHNPIMRLLHRLRMLFHR